MKDFKPGVWTTIAFLSLVGCAGTSAGSSTPHTGAAGANTNAPSSGQASCKTADSCWTVTSPADYDVKGDCELVKGTVLSSPCDPAGYQRKCTQETDVKEDGKTTKVTWVYLFAAGNETVCTGTEVKL